MLTIAGTATPTTLRLRLHFVGAHAASVRHQMKLRDEPLNIPLYKKGRWNLYFSLACCFVGILMVKPSTPIDWAIAILVVAPTAWFVFLGPKFIQRWQSHRFIFVPWLIFVIKFLMLLWVLNTAVPYLSLFLHDLLNA